MKRIISVIAAVLAVVSVLSSCGAAVDTNAPSGMIQASNDNVDYVMYVPDSWKVDKTQVYTSAFVSSSDPSSISASVFAAGEETTVETWWEDFYKDFKKLYTDVSKVKSEKDKLGSKKATRYTFSGTLNGVEYNYVIVAAMKGSVVYYVTYTSGGDYYKTHLEELDKVVDNFVFK